MPVLLATDQAPTLGQLLAVLEQQGMKAQLVDPSSTDLLIQGIGSLLSASAAEISFISNAQRRDQLALCQAGAVIMTQADLDSLPTKPSYAVVLFDQPYLLYALLAQWFDNHRLNALPTGIHPTAQIHATAVLAEGVQIGPYCVVEAGVHIGSATRLGPGCVIGADTHIGANSLLHARVTIYHQVQIGERAILHSGCVIGADGFGFAPHPAGGWAKIAQIGSVRIGNDVEIGANTTIDRGALDGTVIADGVKLDNQIMVGHNVHIGTQTAIAACVGIAGSTI